MNLEKQIGKGKDTEVYVHEGRAIKLFKEGYGKAAVFYEGMTNAFIEQLDLPVPRVLEIGNRHGRWYIAMELIDGITVGREINQDLAEMAKLQRRIHALESPLPINSYHILKREIELAPLSDEQKSKLTDSLDGMPFGIQLCHFNFHGGKIIKNEEGLHVLDWMQAKGGNPEADVAKTYAILYLLSSELAEAYLAEYEAVSDIEKEDILRWLPLFAVERLLEVEPDERQVYLDWIDRFLSE